jgi:hypothetical protein
VPWLIDQAETFKIQQKLDKGKTLKDTCIIKFENNISALIRHRKAVYNAEMVKNNPLGWGQYLYFPWERSTNLALYSATNNNNVSKFSLLHYPGEGLRNMVTFAFKMVAIPTDVETKLPKSYLGFNTPFTLGHQFYMRTQADKKNHKNKFGRYILAFDKKAAEEVNLAVYRDSKKAPSPEITQKDINLIIATLKPVKAPVESKTALGLTISDLNPTTPISPSH